MRALILIVVGLVLLPTPAMAYIDPASGSAIVSAIVGFFIATTIVVKRYWYKIKSLFTRQASSSDEPNEPDS